MLISDVARLAVLAVIGRFRMREGVSLQKMENATLGGPEQMIDKALRRRHEPMCCGQSRRAGILC